MFLPTSFAMTAIHTAMMTLQTRSRDTQSHMTHSFIALVTVCNASRDASKHALQC